MIDREKSKKDLLGIVKAQRELGYKGAFWDNKAIASNTLEETVGKFGKYPSEYSLDNDERDVLLAHTRQDVAHALLNTLSLMKTVNHLRAILLAMAVLNIFIIALIIGR